MFSSLETASITGKLNTLKMACATSRLAAIQHLFPVSFQSGCGGDVQYREKYRIDHHLPRSRKKTGEENRRKSRPVPASPNSI